jgi:hypothetical protein
VRVATPRELRAEVPRFLPHLVVSSQATDTIPGVGAWLMLSPEPDRASELRLGGWSREYSNPDLGVLIAAVESVERLVRDGRHFRRP